MNKMLSEYDRMSVFDLPLQEDVLYSESFCIDDNIREGYIYYQIRLYNAYDK